VHYCTEKTLYSDKMGYHEFLDENARLNLEKCLININFKNESTEVTIRMNNYTVDTMNIKIAGDIQ